MSQYIQSDGNGQDHQPQGRGRTIVDIVNGLKDLSAHPSPLDGKPRDWRLTQGSDGGKGGSPSQKS